jgi:hypothetical protein
MEMCADAYEAKAAILASKVKAFMMVVLGFAFANEESITVAVVLT